jgi:chromosome segregation protein
MYDDESQSAQGMLSHRIRLDEIEQALLKSSNQNYKMIKL